MKQNICDYCSKVVDTHEEGAIHGVAELYVNRYRSRPSLETSWWRELFAGRRIHKRIVEEGVWCNAECFIAWVLGTK